MVQITERATTELQRLLTDNFARPQQGVRLRLNEAGDLAMTIDIPHSGDSIIRRDNLPVLIVDGRLATRLADAGLSCALRRWFHACLAYLIARCRARRRRLSVVKRSKPQMGICRKCRSVRVLVGGLCRDCRDADSGPAQGQAQPATPPQIGTSTAGT